MTVSTAPTPLSYSGNGSTTAFPVTWKYNAKSHVVATLRSSAGVETVQTLTTHYTLTDPGDSGTLTMLTAPATGETLVITLEPPNTQSSDIPLGGDFPSTTMEDGLDLAAQRDAKIEALFSRSLRVPKTDTQTDSELQIPIDSARANKFLAFDANGAPIAAAGTSADLGPVSAFVDTLLDDTDADTFIQTLLAGANADTFVETLVDDLTAETSPAVGDLLLLSDVSANNSRKMTLQNHLKIINGLTEDTTPDTTADFLVTYDASASLPKKVLPNKFAATQVQQEAGSSNDVYVTPGRQHFNPSAAKCWGFFDGTAGTPAFAAGASYNCDGITDNGTGSYTITITNDMSSANYCGVCNASSLTDTTLKDASVVDKAAGSFRIDVEANVDGSQNDADNLNFVIFGDL